MLHIKFDQDWPTGLRDIKISSEKLWQNDRIRKDKANPITGWVDTKESGYPKPALLDSGSPHTGLVIWHCIHNWRNRHKRDIDAKFGSVFDYQPFAHKNLFSFTFLCLLFTSVRHIITEYNAPKVKRDRQCLLTATSQAHTSNLSCS